MSADVDPDYTEGIELTYLHGVAFGEGTRVPEDLDAIEVPAGFGPAHRWWPSSNAPDFSPATSELWLPVERA